ncbi:Cloroperoxidase [Cladorrhinum sp. PSN259]|nr:Cloroperoxidase [Cladorrhinum sp. PSN259]
MKSTTLFASAIALAIAPAGTQAIPEPAGHHYIPATPADSRSPCPGLNALANHGFLPRSGKNIDLPTYQYAVQHAYNFAHDFLEGVFADALNFHLSTTGNSSTFNLDDLKAHDKIEIDGSLSRNDFYFGDDLHFDPVIWATTANRLGLYDCVQDSEFVTVERAAVARAARVRDAKVANPSFNASAAEQSGSPGTTALYLATLWNETEGAAPKTWVRDFFEKERIPYLLGFDPNARAQQNNTTIFLLVNRILAVDATTDICPEQNPIVHSRGIDGPKRIH